MQLYARFQNEVIADPAAIAAHVARAREVLGDAFGGSSTRPWSRRTTGFASIPVTVRRRSTS